MDNIQKAKSNAILNYNYDELMNEAKEYAGSEWDNLTKSEKEDLIEEMKSNRVEHISRMDEGGEADSEREDEEMEEANERLEELMEEYDLPREVIEEYASNMGVEIDDITDLPFSGRYDSEEDFAEDLVEQGAISNLSYYLEMTSLDMRLLAQEEADVRVDDMSDDEILDASDMVDEANEYVEIEFEISRFEEDIDDLKNKLDDYLDEEDLTEGEMEMREEKAMELKEEIDEKENHLEDLQHDLANLDTRDEVVDKAREQLRDVYYDDIHDELERDAVGYFVDTLGYAEEDLASNSLFRVDLEKLARDLSYDYTIIEHGGDVYVFGSYMNGGMTYEKGGVHKVNKKYAYFAVNKKTNKIIDGWEIVDDVESLKYYAKMDLEDNDLNPKDYNLLSAKTLKSRGIDPYSWDSWAKTGEYADGGMTYAKGGGIKSKRYAVYLSTEMTGDNYDRPNFQSDDYDKAIEYAKEMSLKSHPKKPQGFEYSDYDYVSEVYDKYKKEIIADFAHGEYNYVENPKRPLDSKYLVKKSTTLSDFLNGKEYGIFYSKEIGATNNLIDIVESKNKALLIRVFHAYFFLIFQNIELKRSRKTQDPILTLPDANTVSLITNPKIKWSLVVKFVVFSGDFQFGGEQKRCRQTRFWQMNSPVNSTFEGNIFATSPFFSLMNLEKWESIVCCLRFLSIFAIVSKFIAMLAVCRLRMPVKFG
jgi:hypothetical protein